MGFFESSNSDGTDKKPFGSSSAGAGNYSD